MNPATILYRLGTLVSEGYTTLAEAESLAGDRQVFEAWLCEQWRKRDEDYQERLRRDWERIDQAWQELVSIARPAIAAWIKKNYGSWAAYMESPEGQAAEAEAAQEAEKMAKLFRIKSPKEVAAWWRERREKV